MSIGNDLAALASNISMGVDIYANMENFGYWGSFEDAKRIFVAYGIRWNSIVEHDVNLVIGGNDPEYFMPTQEWVDLYRSDYHIRYQAPSGGTVYGSETIKHRSISELIAEIQQHADESYKTMGWACPVEQKFFYRTPEWERRAKAARYASDYACDTCGETKKALHVHHEGPIISAYHYNFDNNFAYWKLTVLCESCHKRTHSHSIRDVFGVGYVGASYEDMKDQREWLRKSWAEYHDNGECKWCNNHWVGA